MKLLRIGDKGKEKPAILDNNKINRPQESCCPLNQSHPYGLRKARTGIDDMGINLSANLFFAGTSKTPEPLVELYIRYLQ